jgi:hypothetical protein
MKQTGADDIEALSGRDVVLIVWLECEDLSSTELEQSNSSLPLV